MSNTLGIGNFLKKAGNYSTNTFLGTEKDGVRTGGFIDETANRLFKEGDSTSVAEGLTLKGIRKAGSWLSSTGGKAALTKLAPFLGKLAPALGAVAGPLAMILAIKGSQAKRKEKLRQEQNMLAIAPAATRFRA